MNPIRKKEPSQLKVSVQPRKSETEESNQQVLDDDQTAPANLDKVRDILFGAQSRDYDKRFVRLEDQLLKEAADLRNDLKHHFDSLEMYVKKEVELLTNHLKSEQNVRLESNKELSREIGDLNKQIQARMIELDNQSMQGQRDLQQQILDQHKRLSQDLTQKSADLTLMLEKALEELRREKLDRAALAELFMESALRLNHEFHLPTEEPSS